ncbi:glycosyltransferase [Heyndrickxia coagulans]|uniref:glycosyltransferase n=1 Tax=Heyndrickxia coagulans TaxID=1398 RepID=UPI0007791381|nr:glycosyltransferase [Heyndrickxia coagulans]KYC63715.1 hypothetical protein B4100_0933 [Heyndrickxia coagulans]MED4313614.1 glycosyltransferase [Heyndrickxia coagulans]UZH05023.1 glycosyltransferase [Heyndrickxia coagulans]
MKKFVIIILNYNNYSETIDCVENLLCKNVNNPIIIVDNYSSNGSYEILYKYYETMSDVYVIKSDKNGGYAYGNNFGIRYALNVFPKVKYFVIQNPDIRIISKDIFYHFINILESDEKVKVVGAINILNGRIAYEYSGWNLPTKFDVFKSLVKGNVQPRLNLTSETYFTSYVDVVHGCFFMVNIDFLQNGELFDEGTFLYNEENILALKLKSLGYKEVLSLRDFCYHNQAENNDYRTTRKTLKTLSKSNVYMLKKYYNLKEYELLIYMMFYFYAHLRLWTRKTARFFWLLLKHGFGA